MLDASVAILIICAVGLFAFVGGIRGRRSSRKSLKPRHFSLPDFGSAYKNPAKSESFVRSHIYDLPRAEVIFVVDGDTVDVTIAGERNTLRLDSIDCPEDGQSWGNFATAGLIKMIGGKTVVLEQHGQDPYGRTLATIYVHFGGEKGWVNVNERMVMLGHAWVMKNYFEHLPYDRQQKLIRLERWARSKRIGLWSESDPVPPWIWRRQRCSEGDGQWTI